MRAPQDLPTVPKAQVILAALAFASVAGVATANAGDVLLHRWQRSGISHSQPTTIPKTSMKQSPTVKKRARRTIAGANRNASQAQARSAVAEVENLAPPPPKNIEATMAGQEMRGLLRSMTSKERNKVISDAIAADDNGVLSAVMHGHALASGLGPLELNALRLRWRKSRYPQQVERRDRLLKATDDLERIAHLFGGWTEGLTDAKAIAAAENRESEAKAAEQVAVP